MCCDELSLLRLRVVADADPGALARVLERFQNLNVLPRSVTAELCTTGAFHVQVDIAGVAESTLTSIAAKLGQTPCIQNAYWHRV
jgi:hypothetical protein